MKNIITTLKQIEQAVAQLSNSGTSAIERDLALRELQNIYDLVLQVPIGGGFEEVPEQEEQPIVVAVPEVEIPAEQPVEDLQIEAEAEEPVEESVIELIEELIEEVEELPENEEEEAQVEAPEETVEESVIELIEDLIEEVEELPDSEEAEVEAETEEEPEFGGELTPEVGELNIEPFGEEVPEEQPETVVKNKIDHKRLLSLYDDDEEFGEAAEPFSGEENVDDEFIASEEEEIVFDMTAFSPEEVEIEEEEAPQSQPFDAPAEEKAETNVVAEASNVVLGDVLGGEHTTLAEQMAANASPDVASVVASGATSLAQMVGVNDKYILMRDLFESNVKYYEQSMEVLDSFESLDEAMLFIYDNFTWNPNSEGAKLLMELLSRKLL